MPLILRDIWHRYVGGPWILRGVHVAVDAGDTVAILGPSGSGKTTLLSIMGLLQSPTRGNVEIDGQLVQSSTTPTSTRLRCRRFGWIFQSVNVLSHRSTLDNAAIPLLSQGWSRVSAENVARKMLADVGLSKTVEQKARDLSGGELQRLCIARAMTTQPSFLLADEPTGQLDHTTSERVLDALWSARTSDTAMICVTHDQMVAERRYNRMLWMTGSEKRGGVPFQT